MCVSKRNTICCTLCVCWCAMHLVTDIFNRTRAKEMKSDEETAANKGSNGQYHRQQPQQHLQQRKTEVNRFQLKCCCYCKCTALLTLHRFQIWFVLHCFLAILSNFFSFLTLLVFFSIYKIVFFLVRNAMPLSNSFLFFVWYTPSTAAVHFFTLCALPASVPYFN